MTGAPSRFGRLRSRLVGTFGGGRYGVAALDQMALSVFGFGLNLLLIRALSATDYGAVSLWMTMGLLSIAVQNALVNGPLNIHVPVADPVSARRLEEALGIVNLLAIGLTTASVVVANLLIDAEWVPHDREAAIAIPVFIAAGMYREYYRSMAFGRNDMAMLLWTDGPYLAVTTFCLGAMLVWPEQLANLAVAFFAMSAGCIVSQICLRARSSVPKLRPFRRGWLRDYRAILGDVKWALVGVLATHLRARSYMYITVNLINLAALAALNVVGVLFRPMRILMNAWARRALSNMAAQLAEGRIAAFDRAMLRALAAASIGSAAWFVVLWLAWTPIERYFLAGNYPDAWSLMWPWAIAAGFNVLEYTLGVALQAAREFKFLAYATLLGAPVTLVATVAAVLWHGYSWTMYGVALGSLTTLTMYCGRLHAVRRKILAASGPPRPSAIDAAVPSVSQP